MGNYILEGGKPGITGSTEAYDTWNTEQLVQCFYKHGLKEYGECLIKHKITGRLAPLLTESYLREMDLHALVINFNSAPI